MRNTVASLVLLATAAITVGCSSAPQPVVMEQPVAQTQSIAATCINSQGIVMADQWCDPNYISQQRAIAIQQNNQILLDSLILSHMVYSSRPYAVGVYMPSSSYYTTAPRGYVVQPRSVYVTHSTVVNHTTVTNTSRPTQVTSRPTFSSSSPSASRTPSYTSRSSTSASRPSFSSSRSSSRR